MSARIGKRVREGAILICDILASTPHLHSGGEVAIDAWLHITSATLATAAWLAAYDGARRLGVTERPWCSSTTEANAAALLRDGWQPGEPVRLLKRGGAK